MEEAFFIGFLLQCALEFGDVSPADRNGFSALAEDQLPVYEGGDFMDVDNKTLMDPDKNFRIQFFFHLLQRGIKRINADGSINVDFMPGFFEEIDVVLQNFGQNFLFSMRTDRNIVVFPD